MIYKCEQNNHCRVYNLQNHIFIYWRIKLLVKNMIVVVAVNKKKKRKQIIANVNIEKIIKLKI